MGEKGKTDEDYKREQAEHQRKFWHHEVKLKMLEVLVSAATARRLAGAESLGPIDDTIAATVELATRFADLAYPPPKVEP